LTQAALQRLGIAQKPDAPVLAMLATVPSWTKFCRLIGREEWIGDGKKVPQLSKTPERLAEVKAFVESWFAARTAAEAYRILQDAGIVAGAFRSVSDLYDEEMAENSGAIGFVALAKGGPPVPVPGPAFRTKAPGPALPKVPGLGDDSRDILLELGLTQAALQRLGIAQKPDAPAAATD
jgi:crotonobetainyl-CoA:carnitine CoA-transferase CaiB-like acyl-CoA transferase